MLWLASINHAGASAHGAATVLLQDLAVVMIVAGIVTLIFHRLRQPVVLGYILAGVIIGPHTFAPGLLADTASIATLAELGVVFLMFSLGLHFSLRQLKAVGGTAVIAAALEILLMLWLGYEIGRWFGWSQMDSIFLGAILSISSTTIIVKALHDLGKTKAKFAELIFGILIVEDILAIAMIALLSSIAMTGGLQAGEVLATVGRIGIFLSVVLVAGLIAVPPLLRRVAEHKSDEMMLVTVLACCFGVSLLAVKFQYSVALGAFIIGTVIGESREIGKIKQVTEPVRDMFSAVFFVAIGMLIEPAVLVEYLWPIAIVTLAVVVGKVVSCSFGTFVTGHDTRTSLQVGMGLAQIGEFSFIIATLGLTLGVTSHFLYPIAVTVSAITTLLTPYLIRSSEPLVGWFDRSAPRGLVGYLEVYSRWVNRLRSPGRTSQARRLARKWVLQMALNVALISGVLMAARALGAPAMAWWPDIPDAVGGAKGLVWLAALVVALPGVIATVRKLQALAMLVSEVCVPLAAAGRNTGVARMVISQTVLGAGAIALGLWIILLSATLLPSGPSLAALLAIVSLLVVVFWRFFIQIHAKAQLAVLETLAETPPPSPEPAAPLPLMLRDAQLETVVIAPAAAAAGQRLRELDLRARTGASAVGIERDNQPITNPDPDEELRAGDRVLLLGNPKQLAAARQALTESAPSLKD